MPSRNEQKGVVFFLKRYVLAGLAVIVPFWITFYLVLWMIELANGTIGEPINAFLVQHYNVRLPGLGLVVAGVLLIVVGFLSHHFLGHRVLPFFDRVLERIPLFSNIYPSAKQLSDFVFRTEEAKLEDFKKVVLVQFPEADSYSLGFVTNENIAELNPDQTDGWMAVFIPLAPVPFSGHIVVVKTDRIREVNVSIEEAVKFIVSGGVVWKGPPFKGNDAREARTGLNTKNREVDACD